jgi:subtilisin family serine protease
MQRERIMKIFNAKSGFGSSQPSGRFVLVALSLAAAMACGGAVAQGQGGGHGNSPGSATFAAGRILVMPRAGMPDASLDKILGQHGGGKGRRVGRSELRIVDLPPGLEKAMVERLRQNRNVKFAELDELVPPHVSNDPYLGSQWHLSKIGASSAWDSSTGNGIKIAILDTGVDGAHPDLTGRMVAGYNFYDNNTDTRDVQGHGTAVAGSAAATLNNGTGVASVAGGAWIMPIRVSQPDGYAYFSTIAKALTWAADQGARVANISYGVSGSAAVQSSASYMKSKGGLVVVSAGNSGKVETVAASDAMISVSATDSADRRTSWSSYGTFVDIAAPGAGIYTTSRGGAYGSWSGTSFSSPVTAGVVALMMAANPALSSGDVQGLLFATATDLGAAGYDIEYGWGRVDAYAAVQAALAATSSVDTVAPTVSIGSPEGSSSVAGLVAVDVSASDNKGVTRVDLFVKGAKVASDSAAPFAFAWDSTQVGNGMVELVAVAVDAAGNAGTSAPVSVNVANAVAGDTTAPTVTITHPIDGSKVSGRLSIRVSASDNLGAAGLRQDLYINSARVARGSGGSLSYTWDTRKIKAGSYTLQAVARDAAGNTSTSAITVTR